MTLSNLAPDIAKRLRKHTTAPDEIAKFLDIVERDLHDATIHGRSLDGRFMSAYNAALKLCTVVLYAAGYRTSGAGAHELTIPALPGILGVEVQKEADYLDSCRKIRNRAAYDHANIVAAEDVAALISFVEGFRIRVIDWTKENHPGLLP